MGLVSFLSPTTSTSLTLTRKRPIISHVAIPLKSISLSLNGLLIYPCASCNLLNPALPKMCAELCGKRRLYESRGRHWHSPYLTRLPREYVSHVYLWIPPSSSHKTQTCLSPSTLRPSEMLTRSKRWPFSRHHFDGRVNTQCEIGFGSLEVCSHSVDKTGPPRPCDLESVHPSIELCAECRFITA